MATIRHPGADMLANPSKLKERSDIAAAWVTIAGAMAAGVFAIVQYFDAQKADQVKQALAYVERFNKEPYLAARNDINAFWETRSEKLFKAEKAGEKELSGYILKEAGSSRVGQKFSFLVDFYSDLQICTCNHICDAETVRQFFGKEAYGYLGVFFPYMEEQRSRQKDQSFAESLVVLAKNHKDKEGFEKKYCANP